MLYAWWTQYNAGEVMWRPAAATETTIRPGLLRPRFCNYTPAFVIALAPFARLDQKTAYWLWQGLQLLCVGIAVVLLARGADPPLTLEATLVVLALTVISRPLRGTVTYAQLSPMLLALLVAAWFFARRERSVLAGLTLAAAALLKLYPAAAGGYFLFGRRWRALGWTIVFFVLGLAASGIGNWITFAQFGMSGTMGAVHRGNLTALAFYQDVIGGGSANWLVYALTATDDLLLVAIAAWPASRSTRTGGPSDGIAFSLWLGAAILMSPLAWPHETLLLLPLYLFEFLAAREASNWNTTNGWPFVTAVAIVAACALAELIKLLPAPGFPALFVTLLAASLVASVEPSPESAG